MRRNAIAVPLGDTAVTVTMRRGSRGPWSVVVDEAEPGLDPLGPPAGFLALVGIGSCTIVTVAGVASRGTSELVGMSVAFEVADLGGGRLGIRQRTTLEANLTERDRLRLTRAVGHCPIGRDFTRRGVDIDDEVVLLDAVVPLAIDAPGPGSSITDLTPALPALPAPPFTKGSVEVRYLPGTGEWRIVDGRRVLDQEGEVVAHVECGPNGDDRRHWGYLGGHSSAGWAPRPSAYALASLAASSLMTLRRLASSLHIDAATLRVEVTVTSEVPTGGKEASQEAAALGTNARVRWRRTVTAAPTSPEASSAAIAEALLLDPIYRICERGDLLAGDEIVVVAPAAPVRP